MITADGTLSATTIGATGPGAGGPTTAGFTDTTIVYSTTGIPNCTGTGTPLTGSTVTLPMPLPDFAMSGGVAGNGTLNVKAVACGTAESNSPANPAAVGPFAINVAVPVLTTSVGGTTYPTAILPNDSPTLQNLPTVSVKSATVGSYVCYTADGTAPSCVTTGNGCHSNGTVAKWSTFPGTVNITAPTVLKAIACATDTDGATLDFSAFSGNGGTTGTGANGINYQLAISSASIVANSFTAACPTVPQFGFDPANQTAVFAPQLGPTTGAKVCYSTVSQPVGCGAATGVTCFTPGAGAAGLTNLSLSLNSTGTVFVTECAAGFPINAFPVTATYTGLAVSPVVYAPPGPSGVGTLANNGFTANELVAGSAGALQGAFTYHTTGAVPPAPYAVASLYMGTQGYTAAATTHVVYYISDGGTGTTTGITALGGGTLRFNAQWALDFVTGGGAIGTITGYEFVPGAGNGWSSITANAVALTADATAVEDAIAAPAMNLVNLAINTFESDRDDQHRAGGGRRRDGRRYHADHQFLVAGSRRGNRIPE